MSLSKRELRFWLERWGLTVEGDENHAELSEAYRNMKMYRSGGNTAMRNDYLAGPDLYVPRLRAPGSDLYDVAEYAAQMVGNAGRLH